MCVVMVILKYAEVMVSVRSGTLTLVWDGVRITIMVHSDVLQNRAVALSTCGT